MVKRVYHKDLEDCSSNNMCWRRKACQKLVNPRPNFLCSWASKDGMINGFRHEARAFCALQRWINNWQPSMEVNKCFGNSIIICQANTFSSWEVLMCHISFHSLSIFPSELCMSIHILRAMWGVDLGWFNNFLMCVVDNAKRCPILPKQTSYRKRI